MALNIFGYTLFSGPKKTKEDKKEPTIIETSEPESIPFDAQSLAFGFDFESKIQSINDLILVYRNTAANYEVEEAIDDIVNEAIITDEKRIVNLNLDGIKNLSKNIKTKILDEFDYILRLLNFNQDGDSQFRRWYIDGRLYAFSDVGKNPKEGIKQIQIISPLDIVRIKDKTDNKYYFMYKPKNGKDKTGYKISEDVVTFVPSGITDSQDKHYISYIQRAIKPINQLRLLEDSAVIYRISRAPERRVFYIDVGKLPKNKSEEYIKKLMNRFKNKVSYDVNTGKTTQKKDVLTMLEDFYLPTSGDGKGTKVDVLPSGQQLGEIGDILYFKKKLYKSLKVPVSRIDQEDSPTVSFGQDSETTRAELKFSKFINKQRHIFSFLFTDLLHKQLTFKNIVDETEWQELKEFIVYDWASDSYWSQIKENEILSKRIDMAGEISDYVGKYYSNEYVRKNILKQTDDEIESEDEKIKAEEQSGDNQSDAGA